MRWRPDQHKTDHLAGWRQHLHDSGADTEPIPAGLHYIPDRRNVFQRYPLTIALVGALALISVLAITTGYQHFHQIPTPTPNPCSGTPTPEPLSPGGGINTGPFPGGGLACPTP